MEVKPSFRLFDISSWLTDNHEHTLCVIYKINKLDFFQVNLDITTLISLVSNACHGRCNFIFREHILSEQAAQERQSPLLPKLQAFFKGEKMYRQQHRSIIFVQHINIFLNNIVEIAFICTKYFLKSEGSCRSIFC